MSKSTISEQVYEHLMQMVLSMEVKPSEKIPEEKIAKQFGCSRAPIREALKRLSHEGIVDIHPNKVAEIANYSDELIEQIGVVRVFNDIMAIKLAMLFGSKIDFLKMNDLADECYKAAREKNTSLRIRKDCEFHIELAKIGKNQQLVKFTDELYKRIEFIQSFKYDDLIQPENQRKEHQEIVTLLINREERKLIELMVKHDSSFHAISTKYPFEFFIG